MDVNIGNISAGQHQETIDVSSLAQGMYMVTLNMDGSIITKKLSIR